MENQTRILDQPLVEETTHVKGRDVGASAVQGRFRHSQMPSPVRGHHEMDSPISRILVPTDFSKCSDRALQFAVSLAQQCRAHLTILHVVDVSVQSPGGQYGPAADLMKLLWQTGFEQMGKLAFSLSGHVDAQTAIEEGLPCEQIIEKSRQADLLVLGKPRPTHGFKPFRKHTAQRVIENAACPVIVVPDGQGVSQPATR